MSRSSVAFYRLPKLQRPVSLAALAPTDDSTAWLGCLSRTVLHMVARDLFCLFFEKSRSCLENQQKEYAVATMKYLSNDFHDLAGKIDVYESCYHFAAKHFQVGFCRQPGLTQHGHHG